MECLSYKSEIVDTFSNVRSFSFQEKKTPLLDEEKELILSWMLFLILKIV
jgi:hypothetical protein